MARLFGEGGGFLVRTHEADAPLSMKRMSRCRYFFQLSATTVPSFASYQHAAGRQAFERSRRPMLPRFHLDMVCDGLSMSTKDRASTASSSPLWTQASTMQAELPANIRSPRWMYCNSYRISLATLQGDPVAADNSGLSVQGGIKQEPPTNFSCSRVQFKILVRTVNSRLWVFSTW